MSYPSRPGLAGMPGIPPMGMPFMNVPGVPPPSMPMGMPPNLLSGPPPGPNPFFQMGGPPPRSMSGPPPNQGQNRSNNNSHVIIGKSSVPLHLPADHPAPIQMKNAPMGPPVTVFVGNITDKWPDAMIRQLLATCGHVLNWKRVQGASGKLQGFGFCEFNGPDAGLRAVRLLHDIEVGDKKLVVKVDAKTSSVLDEFKADRKKKKDGEDKHDTGTGDSKGTNHENLDYMDQEMEDLDERSRMRISILFREFKNELESYIPPGGNEKPEKDPGSKQAIQDKLHLLKLTSLDAPPSDADASDDLAVEEGKREIITQEISKFREHMKQEKEKEDERKRLGRERREREKERDEREKVKRERGSKSPSNRRRDRGRSKSPVKRTSQPRSASRGNNRSRSRSKAKTDSLRNRDRDRDNRDNRGRRDRDRGDNNARDRDRMDRDRGNRDRRRSRDRSPMPRFRNSRDRERSPMVAPHKRRYREREEEEEAEDQRKLDKKAREKEQAYDERLRRWEERELKKARETTKDKERQERIADEVIRDARKMKQFLEDYDDEKMDPKYYKGKELQKRLSDRAKELEVDNRDRQREREEIEEMRLKVLTGGTPSISGSIPVITLDRTYKKPMMDSTNTSLSSSPSQFQQQQLSSKLKSPIAAPTGNTMAARLLAMAAGQAPPTQSSNQTQNPVASQNNGVTAFQRREGPASRRPKSPPPPPKIDFLNKQETPEETQNPQTEFNSIHFPSFVPIKVRSSNPSTPNSLTSPAPAPELSPSLKSLANTGFQLTMNNNSNASSSVKAEEDDTRHSFSSANSPGMTSPGNYGRDDDSSLQDMSPDFGKKKKMDVKDIFNQDEDDDGFGSARKRTLVPLDYGDSKIKKEEKVLEDKKKHVKSLIDRIPTEKDALFAYEIDWSMVDNTLMEKRIRPWINKKIIEYIGEPEPTLVEFICTKVLAQSEPTGILEDVQMVLDEEAEVFVVKMWRLLIYEIEAKKIGVATAIKAN